MPDPIPIPSWLVAMAPPDTGLTLAAEMFAAQEIARLQSLADLLAREDILPVDLERAIEETAPRTPSDVIRRAMESLSILEFSYTNNWDPRLGIRQSVQAEPYEVGYHPQSGRPVLYAYDIRGPTIGIHSFRLDSLEAPAVVEGAHFAPRWPVQPDTV